MVKRATLDLEVSVSSVQAIRRLRTLCEEADWPMERHEGSRLVDRFAIIMPMAQSTRTLGLKILEGPLKGTEFTCWSETRGSSGGLTIASWLIPGGPEQPVAKAMIEHWVAGLPRCPWQWSFGERSKIGYLLPVWRQSRKKFTQLGFNTRKQSWPIVADSVWPPLQ